MIWIVLLLLATVVVGFLARRRHRADLLSGTDASRPVFSVEPPSGRLGKRKDGLL